MAKRKRDKRGTPTTSREVYPHAARHGDEFAGEPRADRLRPWLLGAMCALFVARPLFPSEAAAYRGDGLPVVMLWIALTVLWLWGAIGSAQFRVRFGPTDAAVMLLVVWHTVAGVWAAVHVSPRPAVNMLWEWIALGLAFFLARQLIVSRREARAVVAVMIALTVALSGYGLYQYFCELPATRAAYTADPEGALRAAGLWLEPGSPQRQLFESRLKSPESEPFATFALTNSLAGYLAPWLVVLAGIAVSTLEDRPLRRRAWPMIVIWLAVVCCGALIVCCLRLTNSRSSWVASAVGVLLVLLVLVRTLWQELTGRVGWKLRGAVLLAGAILVAAAVALAAAILVAGSVAAGVAVGGLDYEVLAEAPTSVVYRVQYWQSTLRMVADRPLVGCGPGNFQNAYTAYKLPEASEEVADPHNFLMEVWATAGTPALLALLAAVACFFWVSSVGPRSHALRGNGPPPAPAQSDVPTQSVGTSNLRFAVRDLQSRGPPHPDRLPVGDGEDTGDCPAWVFAGAACGFLLAYPLGQLSPAPPGMALLSAGLLLAAGCGLPLSGWVYRGRMPALLPAIGVVVLLVNLLAAGGIGFPGVAGSLWLLMALGLNADRPRAMPWIISVGGLIAAISLAAACYLTAYGPVLHCHRQMQSARQQLVERNPSAAERHLLAAAKADPLAAAPWQQWAAIALDTWRQAPSSESFGRFEQYKEEALRRVPNSARARETSGDWYVHVFSRSGRQSALRKAINAYSKAVDLYPHSAICRAKLALACRADGDKAAFRQHADYALRLDQLMTPHPEKRLPEELRTQLMRSVSGP